MLLVIDNYDSFTYNLVQAMGTLGADIRVVRNDKATVDEILAWKPDHLLVSPGPCTPKEAGISIEAVHRFSGRIPILGVCLGHQSIAAAFGGRVIRADRLMHGKTSMIRHDGRGIFRNVPNPFEAMRYHSLIVDRKSLPECLEVTAWSENDELMGMRHREYPIEGVQFHPESIMTPEGVKILKNFLEM
ncbi:MAG TPA: aminodeoxychorismate/anthranilate synthase component II [Thermodesulfobacteriaceae bacterium]|nr:aminodeoxychorismate/anthranilate synthase component II [Thermodesulfobacteriaceae bacterium]